MKKLLALLLALCVLLAAVPVSLAEAEAAPLPQVGDVVHGFEALEIREFPLIDAQIVLFEHQKTGAKLMYIANDDTNRVFDLTFLTEAIDNTGLPHVFEHSTTDGSEKYPSKALFFNLSYQTYNTYMNASTYQHMTTYPVASLSEAQLLKYADYYTDSCLHPIIMEDESIYREEAWRYRLADADDALTIEGTVYSEMLGAITLERAAGYNNTRAAFPGSNDCNVSGGDPAFIPDMTWDTLRSYHDLYYHPSNCIAYLYGAFEDYAAFLALLDEAFSPYERREFTRDVGNYTPITEPVEVSVPYAVEAGSDTANGSVVYYTIVCPGVDEAQSMVLNTLTDLLISEASILQQNLQQALPYGKFSCYVSTDTPDFAVVFVGNHVNAEDGALFRQTVDESLSEVAENGFPQELVDGVMTSLSIDTMLTREASDVGVENIVPNMAYEYASGAGYWGYLDYVEALNHMDEWNRQGLYAGAVTQWLLNSQTTALTTTYPEPGLKEQQDAALAERLAEVKAAMSEEEIAAIVEASNAPDEADDASAYVAQLQAVTVESLPEEVKLYDVADETDEAGVRHIDVTAGVDGIGCASLFLDAAGIPQEELHWFRLLTDMPTQLDSAAHTKAELATLAERYLYDNRIYISLPGSGDDYHPYLRFNWIALDADLAAGYDLMYELVFDLNLNDPQKLLEVVQNARASLKNSITGQPYSVQMDRALAVSSELYRYYDYVNNLDYYAFLGDVEAQLSEDPQPVVDALETVRARLKNSAGAVALYAGNEASIALNRPLADAFLARLDNQPVEPVRYDLPVPAKSEALIVDSGVQYNGIIADYDTLGLEGYEGGLDAVTALVADVLLLPQLRDQYGAYGAYNASLPDDGVYLLSYRDPNIVETFDVYEGLYDQVSALEVDQDTLNGYILSSYAYYAASSGELAGAVSAGLDALQGEPQDKKLTYMRQLKAVTSDAIARYADLYRKLCENGVRFTSGSASAINANAELYDVILNPFGAVDATQVAFADVVEGGEHYEAVRFAFENLMMAPIGEDTFGVDEPADNGDLLAALYVLVGGGLDESEAAGFFAGYGLVPEDIDLDAPMDPADAWYLMSALVGEEIEPLMDTADPAAATRGELAEMLYLFMTEE